MNARLITAAEHTAAVYACAYGADDAAKQLGVSPTTIRRAARQLGVSRIKGRTVAGFILFEGLTAVPISMPYAD